jgi:hypothetical protein
MNKRSFHPRNNLVKDKNGDLLADSHNTVNRWKSYFSQLLNVHNVNDIRQIEIHTAEPLVPGPSHHEVEIAIAMLKRHTWPCSDQILAEVIQAGGDTLAPAAVHKPVKSLWNEEELFKVGCFHGGDYEELPSSGLLRRVAFVRTDVS